MTARGARQSSDRGIPQRFVTVSVTFAACCTEPLVPVIVKVKVPFARVPVCTMSVELALVGFGVNAAVEPAGRPLTESATDPLKAPLGVIVTT